MSRFEGEPHPLLRPYVHSYWGIVRDLSAMGGFTVTPDRYLELVFFADPPLVEGPGGPRPLPACTLIPLLRRPLRIVAKGIVRCAAVRLHAWAGGLLFPPVDTWHDLTAVFGEWVAPVCGALRHGEWESIPPVFDAAMLRALAGARPVGSATVARAFVCPPGTAETGGTEAVAARQKRSRRQVERQVRSLTHQSPKQLVCLSRFQRVRDTLWTRPDTDLSSLAFEAGYADQAHLTRQFRRYAGQSPGEFIRGCARLREFLRAQENVAFVQDG